jgi:hypothetical protein
MKIRLCRAGRRALILGLAVAALFALVIVVVCWIQD